MTKDGRNIFLIALCVFLFALAVALVPLFMGVA